MILSIILLIIVTVVSACITAILVATYMLNTFNKNMKEFEQIQSDIINEIIEKE